MTEFSHRAYGMKINAHVPLPRFVPCDVAEEPDINISIGDIATPPSDLPDTSYKPFSIFNKSFFYLQIPDLCTYLVPSKSEIILSPAPDVLMEDCLLFLYDTVLPVALIKNDVFLFQASAIKMDKGIWMFCGEPGLGKSTIACALTLMKRKRFVEDDRIYLWKDPKSGLFMTKNQSPITELWAPTANELGMDDRAVFKGLVREKIRKRMYDLSERIAKRSYPVSRLYLLTSNNTDKTIAESSIRGIAKINTLSRFIVMNHVIAAMGGHTAKFKFLAELAGQVETMHVDRSRLTTIQELTNFFYAAISE